MGQLYSYFYPEETTNPNAEGTGIKSELKCSQNGSIDQHGPADPAEGIECDSRRDGDSCQPNFCSSPASRGSPEAGSESERGTSADIMSPMATVDPLENLVDVERINIWVKSQGKSVEIDVFPLEKVSVLLQDSCQEMEKDPLKMMLIYEGERMEEKKTVREYKLRGGASVQLVRHA